MSLMLCYVSLLLYPNLLQIGMVVNKGLVNKFYPGFYTKVAYRTS